MTDVQWKRVWELYEEAHALPAEEARSFLARISDDPEIVEEVRAILAAAGTESGDSTGEEEPAAFSRVGERLGRYEVVAPLGRGATAEVYAGRDTVLGRPVALKFVGAEHAGSDTISKRFLREARAASALNHPNIVTVHEVVESGTSRSPVIVMELVEGSPLRKLCGQPMPENQVKRIGGQIASALVEAHSRGIVHRDLKPENVMVRPDGYVKVLDFGLARTWIPSAGSSDVSSTAGLPVGTLRYMSPEQCKGETATAASDVFALGLVLFELRTGVHPFEASSPLDMAHAIVWSEPKFPAAWREVPESFRKLVPRMLAKDPGGRPSAAQVARELEGGLADSPAKSAAPAELPVAPVSLGKAKVSRRWVVGGAVTTAAGAGAFGLRLWLKQDLWRAGILLRGGELKDPAFSPDGSRLACCWKQPSDTHFHIFLLRAAGGDAVQLTRGSSDDVGVVWSPDGTRLSFIRQGGGEDAVYVVPVEKGKEQRIVTVSSNPFSGRVEWHSNQALVVSDEFGTAARRLVRLDLDTGKQQQLTVPPERTRDIAPRLSPDGKWLLFCRGFGEVRTDLFVVSADGGSEPRRLTFDELPKREIRWTPDGRGVLFRSPQKNTWSLWRVGLDGQAVKEVLPLESLLAQFDVRPGSKGGVVVAIASTYATDAIWRAARPSGSGNFSDPARFLSSGRNGVDVNGVISPDGLRVAFVSLRSGAPQIWVSDNQGQSTKQLTQIKGGVQVTVPAWSPDSREIVCAARGVGVFVLDVSGERPQRVVAPAGTEPQFSADGRSVTYSLRQNDIQNLWRVPAGGGTARQLTQDGGVIHRASRDGRWIYHIRPQQPGLWRIPAEGGKAQLALDRVRSDLSRAWALGQNGGIYYTTYDPARQKGTILLFDPVSGGHQPVCRFPMPLPTHTGTLSVAADERWLIFPMRETEDQTLSILPEMQL